MYCFVVVMYHQKLCPRRPVLSIPGSSYENLNRFLAPFSQKLPGANIETNTQDDRKALESPSLEDNEQSISWRKFVHQRAGWRGYRIVLR